MRNIFIILIMVVMYFTHAQQPPTRSVEKYDSKISVDPCVQVYVNNQPIACGELFSKKSKGIITVSKDNVNKIYFNITIKSSAGKNEPPVYLRLLKLKQIDLQELIQYTQDGDEIFVEEYIPAYNKLDLKCSPASFTIGSNS